MSKFLTIPRPPDVLIGGSGDVYLRRWHVIPRNRWFNIYLHNFKRSDDDRALHDHPWINMSILLRGSYIEHRPTSAPKTRKAGAVVCRRAVSAHRVELIDDREVWTLFLTGPNIRSWGFLCPQGWRHWKDFTANNGTTVGRGCDD